VLPALPSVFSAVDQDVERSTWGRKGCEEMSLGPADQPEPNASPAANRPCCTEHWYRKGYYEGSDADWICLMCGEEITSEQLGARPVGTADRRRRYERLRP
jgi:hypothetical protein